MIIATSKDDKCIKSLVYLLEKTYPGISFEITIGHSSRIEVSSEEVKVFEEMNRGIFKHMHTFCEGYIIGWESALES